MRRPDLFKETVERLYLGVATDQYGTDDGAINRQFHAAF
jgi:hypothetical protein